MSGLQYPFLPTHHLLPTQLPSPTTSYFFGTFTHCDEMVVVTYLGELLHTLVAPAIGETEAGGLCEPRSYASYQ
jgi:hypothetical protein